MQRISVKDLLEAGCHFGHQTKRWNPKMREFIYGEKNGIHIINLAKTIHQIAHACNFMQRIVMDGGEILFVGTKRQAQEAIKAAAEKTGMYSVAERWLGGTLTNNATIQKSVKKMIETDALLKDVENLDLKKKEIATLTRNAERLHRNLDGIARMRRLPGVIFIVDICHDDIALKEAKKLKIPIVAIVDTNADPELVDYPIVANDDAVRSIQIIVDTLAEAVKISKELYSRKVEEEHAKEETEEAQDEKKSQEEAENKPTDKPRQKDKRAPKLGLRGKKPAPKPLVRKKSDDDAEKLASLAEQQSQAQDPESENTGDKKKKSAPRKGRFKKSEESKKEEERVSEISA